MGNLHKTALNDHHAELGANMVEFGGWEMPLHYQTGIVQEHLTTRKEVGLFDISHMGRFIVRGKNALEFLQHVLANNGAALEEEEGQYTMIPNKNGGVIDDAYLYRFVPDEYLLVVNAANREKDLAHLEKLSKKFGQVKLTDRTKELAMLSLQGPKAKELMLDLISAGHLPEPLRNYLSTAHINGSQVLISRTGYTGEPICFELFIERKEVGMIWGLLLDKGAQPIGLGARDTLRLEAALPLYGHELDASTSPLEAGLARFVKLETGGFIGCQAIERRRDAGHERALVGFELEGRGVARAGYQLVRSGQPCGVVTSGAPSPTLGKSIGLAYVPPRWTAPGERFDVVIRGREVPVRVVETPFVRSGAPS